MRWISCLILVLIAGCGGNWSPEDIEFLQAIPTRQQLTVAAPGMGTASQGLSVGRQQEALGRSTVLANVQSTAGGVDNFVGGLTAGLDLVRLLTPSQRTTNSRTWGPFPDNQHPSFQVQIVLTRTQPGQYTYELQQRRRGTTDFTTVATGQFVGERAEQGTGSLRLDVKAARTLGTSNDEKTDTVDLTYDMTSGDAKASLTIANADGSGGTISYVVQQQGGGEMTYGVDLNLPNTATSALEHLDVVARWLANGAGRLDVTASGGDLGPYRGQAQECWNTQEIQVYTWRNYDCGGAASCTDGDARLCAISGP